MNPGTKVARAEPMPDLLTSVAPSFFFLFFFLFLSFFYINIYIFSNAGSFWTILFCIGSTLFYLFISFLFFSPMQGPSGQFSSALEVLYFTIFLVFFVFFCLGLVTLVNDQPLII